MIIGDNRPAVIENIRKNVEAGNLNAKAELGDPVLTDDQKTGLIEKYMGELDDPQAERKRSRARYIIDWGMHRVNKQTVIDGLDKIADIDGGAILTSNHFNQLDNTVVKKMIRKKDKRRVYTVIQEANLAMDGLIGLLMNYGDNIPLCDSYDYMRHDFMELLQKVIDEKNYILIYPEQEMWFNYRKPRPCKRGAYHFASQLHCPVIPCFVEIIDLDTMDTDEFMDVRYVIHILDPIYPDPEKTDRQNSIDMAKRNEELWKEAYEKAYGKPLVYAFDYSDIAGYIPPKDVTAEKKQLQMQAA